MSGATQEASYSYFASGKPQQLRFGSIPAVAVNYNYNERDWLTSESSTDFWEHIGYNTISEIGTVFDAGLFLEDNGYNNNFTPQYNGNISWDTYYMDSLTYQNSSTFGSGYMYDNANRFKASDFGYKSGSDWIETYGSYWMPNINYDNDGNITALQRYGSSSAIDKLSYTYASGTDRLSSIANSVGAGSNYSYDSNGNLQSDSRDSIGFIIYNIDNEPIEVYKLNSTEYWFNYDVDGTRIGKNMGGGSYYVFYANGPDGKTEVADEVPYGEDITINLWANGDNIAQVRNNSGSIGHYYYLKDHLGDIKMVLNSSGAVDSYNDYYPYGEQMPNRNSTGSADGRYKYISVEQDLETGLDATGARLYDPWRGGFLQIDPMGTSSPGESPYAYSFDNPITYSDPSGLDTIYTYDRSGKLKPTIITPEGSQTSWGRQDPNYISGDFTGWTLFQWMMIDALVYQHYHHMQPNQEIVKTASGARWYEPKPSINEGIFDLPIGPGGEQAGVNAVNDLLKSLEEEFEPLVKGASQAYIEGDAEEIFQKLTNGGEHIRDNLYMLKDGTYINMHYSKTTELPTIDINRAGQLYEIRVRP